MTIRWYCEKLSQINKLFVPLDMQRQTFVKKHWGVTKYVTKLYKWSDATSDTPLSLKSYIYKQNIISHGTLDEGNTRGQ